MTAASFADQRPRSARRPSGAWLLWGLALALVLAGLVLFYLNRATPLPASWGVPAGMRTMTSHVDKFLRLLISVGFVSTLGAIILHRQPGNPIAWLLCVQGVGVALESLVNEYAVYALFTTAGVLPGGPIAAWMVNWLWVLQVLITLYVAIIFPSGRASSAGWRPAVPIVGCAIIAVGLGSMLEEPMSSAYYLDNPFVPAGFAALQFILSFGYAIFVAAVVAAVVSVVLRARRARGAERQQFKWLVVAAIAGLILFLIGFSLGFLFDDFSLGGVLVNLAFLGFPLAVGIAVLQYRLYDVDLIINRALVYAVLTGLLALIYFGSVAVLQGLLSAVSGQSSAVVIVASTLAIAALFNPLRRRVQAFIDRRFYRRKYDAGRTLTIFSDTMRDETNIERLAGRLTTVVDETMQPAHVTLWLRREPAGMEDVRPHA